MSELATFPVHLSSNGNATIEPQLASPEWYAAYDVRHAGDNIGARLVTQYRFTESWQMWEVHPAGDEVVLCIEGALTLIQQHAEDEVRRIELTAGEYVINPKGVWHTADLDAGSSASCVFITPGQETEHRPRQANQEAYVSDA